MVELNVKLDEGDHVCICGWKYRGRQGVVRKVTRMIVSIRLIESGDMVRDGQSNVEKLSGSSTGKVGGSVVAPGNVDLGTNMGLLQVQQEIMTLKNWLDYLTHLLSELNVGK